MAGDGERGQADDVDLWAFVRVMRTEEEVDAAIMVALVDADGDLAVFEFALESEHLKLGEWVCHVGDA